MVPTEELLLVFMVVSFLRVVCSFAKTNNQNRYAWLDWSCFHVTFELRNLDSATRTLHSNTSCGPRKGAGFGILFVNKN